MEQKLILINPRPDHKKGYFSAELLSHAGYRPAALAADLALPTVKAMVPSGFQVQMVDERVQELDENISDCLVGFTVRSNQVNRVRELSAMFRQRGCTIIGGGPVARLAPDLIRDHCDIVVSGELEAIGTELFEDLKAGTYRDLYVGDRLALTHSPAPDWDGYPLERCLQGSIQVSRGCPYGCEYCDVYQYVGSQVRYKEPGQVTAELAQLRKHGVASVFMCDDNFTIIPEKASRVLDAIRDLQLSGDGNRLILSTQLSLDAADDVCLLEQCAGAGMRSVFVGIESVNEESMIEVGKTPNIQVDLQRQVSRFLDAGIMVMAGMMLGFDADSKSIFRDQFEMTQVLPIPLFTIYPLQAPPGTKLYQRLRKAGRLLPGESVGVQVLLTGTNFEPAQFSSEELEMGMRWLFNRVYAVSEFEQRAMRMLALVGTDAEDQLNKDRKQSGRHNRLLDMEHALAITRLGAMGSAEREMMNNVMRRARGNKGLEATALTVLSRYLEIRLMLDREGIWDPTTSNQPPFV